MDQIRVKTQDTVVGARTIPIPHVRISATTSGGANTVLTTRENVITHVKHLAVANTTGSAATLSINAIPDGGSIGDANAEMVAASVPANSSADISDVIGQMYGPNVVIKAYSGTSDALVIHGWAEEIL